MDTYRALFPHCDSNVLHEPKSCEFCDLYPEAQAERVAKGINFTGRYDDGKELCPSEGERKLETIYRWYGNVPKQIGWKD